MQKIGVFYMTIGRIILRIVSLGLLGRNKPEELQDPKNNQPEKTKHEEVADSSYALIQGKLIRMRKRLPSTKPQDAIKERKELEELRGEWMHLNKQQKKDLYGFFRENDKNIKKLERTLRKNLRERLQLKPA